MRKVISARGTVEIKGGLDFYRNKGKRMALWPGLEGIRHVITLPGKAGQEVLCSYTSLLHLQPAPIPQKGTE